MKKRIGQVFVLALTVFLLVSLVVPVFAADSDYSGAVTGWWDKILYQWTKNNAPYWWGDAIQSVSGFASKEVCGSSSDAVHHASSVSDSEMVKGPDGSFVYATCTYCHERFKVYASDLQQSYEAQVEELPATGVTSAGRLIWHPSFGDVNPSCSYTYRFYGGTNSFSSLPYSGNSYLAYEAAISENAVKVIFTPNEARYSDTTGYFYFNFLAPFAGSYGLLPSPALTVRSVDSSGLVGNKSGSFSSSSFVHYSAGDSFSTPQTYWSLCSSSKMISAVAYWYFPIYEVIPDTLIDTGSTGTTYNIQSRPTSITGDYGIIGDNGQIIKVEGDKIVNETNNTYYNPATGETTTITDWSYNYEDRSYTVTTESGDTVTITYGDENVTIQEGDTIYNVYYLVDGSGSEGPGPDVPPACDHTWTEASRTDPTCSTPGKVTSTCSKCNQTKTETIPAPGHSWVVDRTVQTTYDEEGNLLQQGYTLYSCSVCGEQYKDMEGTGPPADDDIGDGGIIGFLDGLVKSLSENLHGVVELILSFFREIPSMFNGFLAFLTAMFPFLPPELMTLLSFGIAAVVFIGVIKAIRR